MAFIIIAGGRDFKDYELLKNKCDYYLSNLNNPTIISGTATGADTLGEQYAKENSYDIIKFPAHWDDTEGKADWQVGYTKQGKAFWRLAGHMRNKEMAEKGDYLIAFWDGKSTGTKDMITQAKNLGLKVKVVYYENKS